MKSRKDLMESGSSSDEESSKSSDEESTGKKRRNSQSSSNSDSDNDQRKPKKARRVTHSLSEDSENSGDEKNGKEKPVAGSSQLPAAEPMEADKSDLEEGQISSDEGDSDSESSSNSEFDDGYGDDLMGNEEDRNYLEKLSEKERETELFKRAERRDQLKRRWEIERKLKQSRKNENAAKKKDKKPKNKKPVKTAAAKKMIEKPPPKVSMPAPAISRDEAITQLLGKQPEESSPNDYAPDEFFDAKERSKERKKNVEANKTDDKRSSAMAMLKARREGKQKRDIERSEAAQKAEDEKEELSGVGEKSSTKLTTSDVYSSDDSEDSDSGEKPSDRRSTSSRSSSSDSEDEESQKTVYKKPVFISTLAEMNQLRISRHKLERFINLPVFDRTVIGCFVRINIGNNAQSGKIVYRVAEIVGVVETAKIYQFGTGRTNKGIKLKHGTQERVFRLEFVSNQDFTQSEFDAWRDICGQNDVTLPTIDMIEQKKKDVQQAANYTFKEEDIDRIIEEKNRFRSYPTNYAMRKTQLMKDRDAAINGGDEDLANEIGQKIHELEERANELDKKRTSSISLISYINDRNRRKNVEDAEKAIREEAKLNKGLKLSDPFTRRSTKPTMAFKQKSSQDPQEEIMLMPEPPKPNKRNEKKVEEHSSGDKLYELHDFDIDLDVQMPMPTSGAPLPKPVEKTQDAAPKIRRSLNLEDYKKKRGLI